MPTSYLEQQQKYFQSNNKVKEYAIHSAKVHSVDWNSDGRRLASGSFDKSVVTFLLERDRLVRVTQIRVIQLIIQIMKWLLFINNWLP